MGMYDDMIVEVDLGLPSDVKKDFQTKSLDCLLDLYKIGKDYKLYKQLWERKVIEPDINATNESIVDSIPMVESTPKGWEFVREFTGVIDFYTSSDDYKTWYDFRARVRRGFVLSIECTSGLSKDAIPQPPKPSFEQSLLALRDQIQELSKEQDAAFEAFRKDYNIDKDSCMHACKYLNDLIFDFAFNNFGAQETIIEVYNEHNS